MSEKYEKYQADASAELTTPIAQPLMVKHEYRDVKVAEGMTLTLDLEEVKRQLERDFYRKAGLPGLEFGA